MILRSLKKHVVVTTINLHKAISPYIKNLPISANSPIPIALPQITPYTATTRRSPRKSVDKNQDSIRGTDMRIIDENTVQSYKNHIYIQEKSKNTTPPSPNSNPKPNNSRQKSPITEPARQGWLFHIIKTISTQPVVEKTFLQIVC